MKCFDTFYYQNRVGIKVKNNCAIYNFFKLYWYIKYRKQEASIGIEN